METKKTRKPQHKGATYVLKSKRPLTEEERKEKESDDRIFRLGERCLRK